MKIYKRISTTIRTLLIRELSPEGTPKSRHNSSGAAPSGNSDCYITSSAITRRRNYHNKPKYYRWKPKGVSLALASNYSKQRNNTEKPVKPLSKGIKGAFESVVPVIVEQ